VNAAQRPARKVLLVEDQTPIRTLLAETMERTGFDVTACDSSKAALAAFPKIDPDLLIADIDLGSRPNGVELATILRTKAPYLGLLFITNYPSIRAFERTITPPERYAFLQKDLLDSTDRLIEVVESALTDSAVPHRETSEVVNTPIFFLTPAQLEILRSVAAGLTNNEIAQRRDSSLRAVEKMVARTFEALGLSDDAGTNPRILATNMFTRTYGYPTKEDLA
jgi:DNA-binding NarL/FixJ family response regulator